jgi:HAD superfamily hydrolase (TIGR01509 family)
MGQAIQAIVFDCFGVLATDYWEVFLDSLPASADIEKAREIRRAYDNGLIVKVEFNKQIELATGSQFIGAEDEDAKIAKNHKLLSYIRDLRLRGYKIGILSNVASNWLRESFLDKDEQALFDDFVLSYEIGLIKPDPQVFKLTANRLKIPITSIALIDDKSAYCQAAQKVGMSTVLYRNFNQCRRDLELLLID